MVRRSKAWCLLRMCWAGSLALMLCICASGNGVRAEERLIPSLATPDVTSGSPVASQAQGLAEEPAADDSKVRYLLQELITQRLEGAQLSIELAEVRAEVAQIKHISHGQSKLLTALIAVLGNRDRENATLRAETADLRQRLEAAQTEAKREHVENRRLAAELAAAQAAANW